MEMLFKEFRGEPPLFKNQPPVAGAIHWEKSLFHRMKRTIIRFLTLEDMMQTDQGKSVSNLVLVILFAVYRIHICCVSLYINKNILCSDFSTIIFANYNYVSTESRIFGKIVQMIWAGLAVRMKDGRLR